MNYFYGRYFICSFYRCFYFIFTPNQLCLVNQNSSIQLYRHGTYSNGQICEVISITAVVVNLEKIIRIYLLRGQTQHKDVRNFCLLTRMLHSSAVTSQGLPPVATSGGGNRNYISHALPPLFVYWKHKQNA